MPRTRTSRGRPADAEEDFERYRAECRAVDAALEGAKLDETFIFREKTISVRWMWQHLVEEYARHNGHADLIREVIDGWPASEPEARTVNPLGPTPTGPAHLPAFRFSGGFASS